MWMLLWWSTSMYRTSETTVKADLKSFFHPNICVRRGGLSLCDFETCPYSPSKAIVEEYANDPVGWLRDFVCAFEKMTSAGYTSGQLKPPTGENNTCSYLTNHKHWCFCSFFRRRELCRLHHVSINMVIGLKWKQQMLFLNDVKVPVEFLLSDSNWYTFGRNILGRPNKDKNTSCVSLINLRIGYGFLKGSSPFVHRSCAERLKHSRWW